MKRHLTLVLGETFRMIVLSARRFNMSLFRMLIVPLLITLSGSAFAQIRIPPGIQAGIDAYREADGVRAAAIANQIQANLTVPYSHPTYTYRVPVSSYDVYGYRSAPYGGYVYGVPQPYGYQASSEYYRRGAIGGTYRRSSYGEFSLTYGPYSSAYLGVTIQPRPIYPAPIEHPIGRREVQTGPNRWESYPVYADEPREQPAFDSYELPRYESRPRNEVEVQPKFSPSPGQTKGPREF